MLTLLLFGLPIGCGEKRNSATLDAVIKKLRPTQPSALVAMAFDPDDPDRRRDGVAKLSQKSWGLEEPYLKGYATLLRTDTDPLVRCVAVRALGMAGDKTYLPDVVKALDDESASVRWDAAVALDNFADDGAVDPLRKHALEDASMDVRAACARALRHHRAPRVAVTLRRCLLDDCFTVRYQAHASLVAIGGQDLGYEPENWPDSAFERADGPAKGARRWWDWFRLSRRSRPKPDQSKAE